MKRPMMILWPLILVSLGAFIIIRNDQREPEPNWQDNKSINTIEASTLEVPDSLYSTGSYVKPGNCYGLALDFDLFNEEIFMTWGKEQRALYENYWDIKITFEGKEFVFMYDEFKAVIENNDPSE